ncbi:MAG: CinA family protein [Oligoflexia bacterium]|nr:CinA family protein [Oligoflexia bacterium]
MKSQQLVAKVAQRLTAVKKTLGIAESCTGGMISAALTKRSGASRYFLGSIVSYDNSVKHDLLNVPQRILTQHGAVSKETVSAMAKGARKNLKVDWAVAVTGIAGPTGGTKLKPIGLVHFAVAGPKIVKTHKCLFNGSRNQIQQKTVVMALKLLLKQLTQK